MLRRQAARLATVGALLGGLVAVGASPAFADDDSVRVRSAGSFTAGGSPEGVSVEIRKRSDGCVLLRTALGLRLDGLSAEQVQVQVNYGGRWWPVPVGGGGGQVGTTQTSPRNPTLCKGKSITIRYRIAFAAGTPGGRLEVAGEASSAAGKVLGRGADTSRVAGGRATASPTPSKKPSPTPKAVATEPVTTAEPASAVAAGLDPAAGQSSNAAEESSGGSMIMFFGIAMVLVGAGLIALLVRNSRADKPPADDYSPFPGVPLPRNPGGTTYRSGGGAPGAPVPPPGQVYGQQPPAARPSGGVYGGTPAPRPGGGAYGGTPTPPPHQSGTSTPPPGGEPGGGDATTFMPRLPG